jgi:hypothetical protein
MPAAHIEPQIVPPEQETISCGSIPASSNARWTPIRDTQAPAPPPAITAMRSPSKRRSGRGLYGGKTSALTGARRSTPGSGNSARRARTRKDGSSVALTSSTRSRAQPKPRSTL